MQSDHDFLLYEIDCLEGF